jgi:hypothetical protein
MTLNSSGQVGIGVSTPISAQLHIVAGGSADRNSCLRIKNTNVGQSGITLDGTSAVSGHQYNIWTTAAGELNPVGGLSIYDDTAGAYRMVISSGGNVGIGTAVPSTTLHVNGTVTASGYALSSNVSVSQQGYTMLPGNVRMQWGYVNIQYTGGSQGFSVSFPVSFTSSCYSVTITPTDPGYGYSYINYGYGAGTITTTTFTIYMKNVNGTSAITTTGLYFSYIAIGN